jgi:hypothetical protein
MNASERIEALRHKPWYSVDLPTEVENGIGMIHADERRIQLHGLAAEARDSGPNAEEMFAQ